MIMFCPFVGEIISAKVRESDANGLRRMSDTYFSFMVII